MKTYSELHSEWVYDWPNIIWNIRHGLFTEEEAHEWGDAAAGWAMCACGNQCAALPRDEEGAPLDDDLRDYGERFMRYIVAAINAETADSRECYSEVALNLLAAIEARAAELLK